MVALVLALVSVIPSLGRARLTVNSNDCQELTRRYNQHTNTLRDIIDSSFHSGWRYISIIRSEQLILLEYMKNNDCAFPNRNFFIEIR